MQVELIHYRRNELGGLIVHVDDSDASRCYELESHDGERWELVAWWSDDCVRHRTRLPYGEEECVTRWVECSPQVDDAWREHVSREQFSGICEW